MPDDIRLLSPAAVYIGRPGHDHIDLASWHRRDFREIGHLGFDGIDEDAGRGVIGDDIFAWGSTTRIRAVTVPLAGQDPIEQIDRALAALCPCGAEPSEEYTPYCSYDCKPTHRGRDTEPMGRAEVAVTVRRLIEERVAAILRAAGGATAGRYAAGGATARRYLDEQDARDRSTQDFREQALQARRNRNTGPTPRPTWPPRRIDPSRAR